eukprot:365869-Chlamydomonas_euryale.AAC.8
MSSQLCTVPRGHGANVHGPEGFACCLACVRSCAAAAAGGWCTTKRVRVWVCDVTTLDSSASASPTDQTESDRSYPHLNDLQAQKVKEGTRAGKGTNKGTKRTQGMHD